MISWLIHKANTKSTALAVALSVVLLVGVGILFTQVALSTGLMVSAGILLFEMLCIGGYMLGKHDGLQRERERGSVLDEDSCSEELSLGSTTSQKKSSSTLRKRK